MTTSQTFQIEFYRGQVMTVVLPTVPGNHCQQCGSTDPESISPWNGNDGYSACCNELVVTPDPRTGLCDRTDCSHFSSIEATK